MSKLIANILQIFSSIGTWLWIDGGLKAVIITALIITAIVIIIKSIIAWKYNR